MNKQQKYILVAALLLILMMVFIISQPMPEIPNIPDSLLTESKPKEDVVAIKESPQNYYNDEIYLDGGYYTEDGFYVDNITSVPRMRVNPDNVNINLVLDDYTRNTPNVSVIPGRKRIPPRKGRPVPPRKGRPPPPRKGPPPPPRKVTPVPPKSVPHQFSSIQSKLKALDPSILKTKYQPTNFNTKSPNMIKKKTAYY